MKCGKTLRPTVTPIVMVSYVRACHGELLFKIPHADLAGWISEAGRGVVFMAVNDVSEENRKKAARERQTLF